MINGGLFSLDDQDGGGSYEATFFQSEFTAVTHHQSGVLQLTPNRKATSSRYPVRPPPGKGKRMRSPEKFSKKKAWLECTTQQAQRPGFKRCFIKNSEYETKEERLVRKKECLQLQRRALFKTRYEMWELQEQLWKMSKKVSRTLERIESFLEDDLSEDSDISEENAARKFTWGKKDSDEELEDEDSEEENDNVD
jgi:hypothetical protein